VQEARMYSFDNMCILSLEIFQVQNHIITTKYIDGPNPNTAQDHVGNGISVTVSHYDQMEKCFSLLVLCSDGWHS
jgi:hypothetical protein